MGKKPDPKKGESLGEKILAAIVEDAIRWSVEGDLKPPFHVNVEIKDSVFRVEVSEKVGKERSVTCTFRKDGIRSMYQLDRYGG